MGMNAYIRTFPGETLAAFLENEDVFACFDYKGELDRWALERATPAVADTARALDRAGRLLEFDKAFQGVHTLLCDNTEPVNTPLGFILGGGTPIGDDPDMPFEDTIEEGWTRVFFPTQTFEINHELCGLSDATLRSRFSVEHFDGSPGCYPGGWSEQPGERLAWLMEKVGELRLVLQEAADNAYGFVTAWS